MLELEGRKGFAMAMLREYTMRRLWQHSGGDSSQISGTLSSDSRTRRSSLDPATASRTLSSGSTSRRTSGLLCVGHISTKSSRSGSGVSSRIGSRYIGTKSRPSSNTSSRKGSRPGSASRSSRLSAVEGKEDHDDMVGRSVMNLKGLPPSEAMLSRKQFRACSVDLTNNAKQGEAQPSLLLPGLLAVAGGAGVGGGPGRPLGEASGDAVAEALRGAKGGALAGRAGGTSADRQTSPTNRKVKPVQDSLLIVTDAIAKLSEVERNRDADGDESLELRSCAERLAERLPETAATSSVPPAP